MSAEKVKCIECRLYAEGKCGLTKREVTSESLRKCKLFSRKQTAK